MDRKIGIMVGMLLMSAWGTTVHAGVAAKFDIQSGGTAGKGVLHGVAFDWIASGSIDKTMDTLLRVNQFSGDTLTFTFASPVNIDYFQFWGLNPSSVNRITCYDAQGAVLPVDKTSTSSPDEVSGFTNTVEDGSSVFSPGTGKDNYSAKIDLQPAVSRVSKIVIEVKKEIGLLDIRIGGSAGR